MFILIALLSLTAAGWTADNYEVSRAKSRLSEYGMVVFRDEKIVDRAGVNGSNIRVYCASTSSRNFEDKVENKKFLWIVSVQPAHGYLSDYERGQWDNPAASDTLSRDKSDFQKLCVGADVLADEVLLSSTSFKSSGSTYFPLSERDFALTPEWVTGAWVYTDSCATSFDLYFKRDGTFDSSEGRGTWSVSSSKITLEMNETYIDDDRDKTRINEPTIKVSHPAIPKGIDIMTFNGDTMIRC